MIIAEAGVNHNGSMDMSCKLIDVAAEAGADVVKFQSFRADQIISSHAPKAAYQTRTTDAGESQLEMVRKLELSEEDHASLMAHARSRGVGFMSTPFDLPSLLMLTQRLHLETIKVSSGDITNAPLLLEMARTGARVILSTGMSTMGEVEAALGVLAFGYIASKGEEPSTASFRAALASDAGQKALRHRVSLLHCTTEYPAPYADVNLKAMDTMGRKFGLPMGLSDHTPGIHIPIAAVARGAQIIEKHFTLDRELPGPDHAASLEPVELKQMVRAIRDVQAALGDGEKQPSPSEMANHHIVRRSLVAAREIKAGKKFGPEDLIAKRPGDGLSPFFYWEMIGKVANRNYMIDEAIEL